uniref:Uncharacterized protein n=1 Tax=Anguilla anguilla TaxID=7936 RepID=A0A0E9XSU1_ANGAN
MAAFKWHQYQYHPLPCCQTFLVSRSPLSAHVQRKSKPPQHFHPLRPPLPRCLRSLLRPLSAI